MENEKTEAFCPYCKSHIIKISTYIAGTEIELYGCVKCKLMFYEIPTIMPFFIP